MMKYVVALIIALSLNAAANLLIKFGMRAIDLEMAQTGSALSGGVMGLIRLLLRHWVVLMGLACFALNVVFYSYALQKLPISIAYPVMTITGFAIIVVVAGSLLNERLSLLQWVGIGAILVGVTLVAKDAGRQMGSPKPAVTAPSSTL
jgi:small multidrug resistance pump